MAREDQQGRLNRPSFSMTDSVPMEASYCVHHVHTKTDGKHAGIRRFTVFLECNSTVYATYNTMYSVLPHLFPSSSTSSAVLTLQLFTIEPRAAAPIDSKAATGRPYRTTNSAQERGSVPSERASNLCFFTGYSNRTILTTNFRLTIYAYNYNLYSIVRYI